MTRTDCTALVPRAAITLLLRAIVKLPATQAPTTTISIAGIA
jgi:hypothetical protein